MMMSQHEMVTGPLLGNLLVAGIAGVVTMAVILAAIRMVIYPGEEASDHPKRRILDPDR
jgi:hypothetical protein